MRQRTTFGTKSYTPVVQLQGRVGDRWNTKLIVLCSIRVIASLAVVGWLGHSVATAESGVATVEASAGRMWVTADRAERRTCPSDSCGVVGQLFFREAANVVELKDGWARITDLYDAGCEGGDSVYVDSGNAACTTDNGITDGKFAEWVRLELLSAKRPADPAEGATGIAKLVGQSDDFRIHQTAFVRAAQQLIADRRCAEADFREQGGFVKSSNHKGAVYFIYCGGMTASNRLYLDASTGRIFR